jgi:hypothetical protein
VQEVQTPNARESLRDNVREDAAPALGVHGFQLGGDVPDLHDAVDPDEDVWGLEGFAVPEEHPGADADVADGVVGDELDDFVQLLFLGGVWGVVLPELVEPGKLETVGEKIEVSLCVWGVGGFSSFWVSLITYSCCGKKNAPMK